MTPPPAQPSIQGSLPGAVHNATESASTALYRAALGPVNIRRYLPVFVRFDEAGRACPSWNWAAALLTLNWLVFRQLWGAALLYVAAVEGLVLLMVGLGRGGLTEPSLAEWGFLGTIFVLSCLVPGLYGNAWLHADARRRMTRAVRDAKTVREACATLAQRASNRRRLVGLAVINVLLAAAAVGAYWGLSGWMAGEVPTSALRPAVIVPAEGLPMQAEKPSTLLPEPSPSTPAPAVEPMPLRRAEPETVEAPTLATPATPATPETSAIPVSPPAAAPPPVPSAPQAGFAINVGLFADAGNADRVHTRLLEAGLPAYIQVVAFPNGQRTRVRVGPFASQTLADEAAERIRVLGLEARVFRQ